jgi:hypothetical protein
MIIRHSPLAVSLFLVFALANAAQNSPAQAGHPALGDSQQACPTISVSCPDDFKDGEPLTFTAKVSGGNQNVVPIYDWTVSVGKIIQGQGSPSIKVDMTGFPGQAYTATVSIAGFDSACPATASCSLIIDHLPNSIQFDSLGILPRKKEITRLNAFAVQLQKEPGARGYLLVCGGRRGRAGEAQKAAMRAKDYLIKTRGIDARRIVTVDAGFREKVTIDLWVVPTGANPPAADPTPDPSGVTTKTSGKRN